MLKNTGNIVPARKPAVQYSVFFCTLQAKANREWLGLPDAKHTDRSSFVN